MAYRNLIVERDGALAKVALNRPEILNTLSLGMLEELKEVAGEFRDDPGVRVVILTGVAGKFTAGMDLKDPEIHRLFAGSMKERRERVTLGPDACRAWEEARPVTIAAVEGCCVGGGVSLAISCDFRIMGRSAFMRVPEIELGLNYSWGSLPRLVNLIGPARTRQMLILGEHVPAPLCVSWGLAEEAVDDGDALTAAEKMARTILAKPPIPVAMTKQAITRITAALDRAGIYMDADQFLLTTYTEDFREGVTSFLEKRPPRFKGK
jgi:enoyl-CoA hydratase